MFNPANFLSAFRLVAIPFLLIFAWTDRPLEFLVMLACSLFSDMIDGTFARRRKQASLLGTRLDSWGDFATYSTVPLCAWWLWPGLLRQEAIFVVAVVAAYLIPVMIGYLKYRQLTSYHTWGAKTSAILVGGSAFYMFSGGPAWPFECMVPFLILASVEEIALTLLLPQWHSNVQTFWHGLKLVRDPGTKPSSLIEN